MDGSGTFLNNGGNIIVTSNIIVANGSLSQTGSSIVADAISVGYGGTGTVNLTGNVTVGSYISVGATDLFYGPGNGTVVLNNPTLDVAFASIINRVDQDSEGTIQGWGTVTAATFVNNGNVIADNGTLTIDAFIDNDIDNTANHGWSASRDGKLVLPALDIAGIGTYYWGDDDNDLVGSIALEITDIDLITSPLYTLDIALLGIGNSELPSEIRRWETGLGLFDFEWNGDVPDFFTANLTIRYNDDLVIDAGGESKITGVHWFDNGTWEEVDVTFDTLNKRVTFSDITSFSGFGIAHQPEPTTWILILIGLGILGWKKRKILF